MKQFVWVLAIFVLASCSALNKDQKLAKGDIDVFGVELYSSVDHKTINGEKAQKEPCLMGCEYSFEGAKITIGYSHNGRVRRIVTRNAQNSMFGIKPGEGFELAKAKAQNQGFAPGDTPYNYKRGGLSLTLLADESAKVFGLALETPN